jgi:hypothetical protein
LGTRPRDAAGCRLRPRGERWAILARDPAAVGLESTEVYAYEAREGVSFYYARLADDFPGTPKPTHCGVYVKERLQTDSTCFVESAAWFEPTCRKEHEWTIQVNLTSDDRLAPPLVVLFVPSSDGLIPVSQWGGTFTHCDPPGWR